MFIKNQYTWQCVLTFVFVTIATRHYTNNFVSYTHSKIHHGLLKFRLNIKVATQNCIESIQYQDESSYMHGIVLNWFCKYHPPL